MKIVHLLAVVFLGAIIIGEIDRLIGISYSEALAIHNLIYMIWGVLIAHLSRGKN